MLQDYHTSKLANHQNSAKVTNLTNKNNQLETNLKTVIAERDGLKKDAEKASASAKAEAEALTNTKDEEISKMKTEIDNLKANTVKIKTLARNFKEKNEKANTEMEALKAQLDELQKENEKLKTATPSRTEDAASEEGSEAATTLIEQSAKRYLYLLYSSSWFL